MYNIAFPGRRDEADAAGFGGKYDVTDDLSQANCLVMRDAGCAKDFIENGNVRASANLPDVSLGPFGSEAARISIVMREIEQPILMAAMMFRGLPLRAVAGGTRNGVSYALVAADEPVTSVPKVEGVVKVRVLQDI